MGFALGGNPTPLQAPERSAIIPGRAEFGQIGQTFPGNSPPSEIFQWGIPGKSDSSPRKISGEYAGEFTGKLATRPVESMVFGDSPILMGCIREMAL